MIPDKKRYIVILVIEMFMLPNKGPFTDTMSLIWNWSKGVFMLKQCKALLIEADSGNL